MTTVPGFRIPEPTATLVLANPEFARAEIRARVRLSPALFFGARQWIEQATDGASADATIAAVRELSSIFVEHGLIGWNLEDDKGPIAPTVDGLMTLDIAVILDVITSWMNTITRPRPLPGAPTAGQAAPAGLNRKQRRSTPRSSGSASSPRTSTGRTSGG